MIFRPEQLILDHEICMTAYDLMHGFDFNSQDMALDIIERTGPRNHFLMDPHTLEHIRDIRLSPLLHQHDDRGIQIEPKKLALQTFIELEETHHPKPLTDDVLDELDRIIGSADRQL